MNKRVIARGRRPRGNPLYVVKYATSRSFFGTAGWIVPEIQGFTTSACGLLVMVCKGATMKMSFKARCEEGTQSLQAKIFPLSWKERGQG
jgi:hypothetical protein